MLPVLPKFRRLASSEKPAIRNFGLCVLVQYRLFYIEFCSTKLSKIISAEKRYDLFNTIVFQAANTKKNIF